LDAINNDLNTPQALAILHRHISNISPGGFNYKTLLEMDKVLGLEIEKGLEVERELKASSGSARFYQADIVQDNQVSSFINKAVKDHGPIYLAINNAGIDYDSDFVWYDDKPLSDIEIEHMGPAVKNFRLVDLNMSPDFWKEEISNY
jgi:NAD(P)-dependent dehydrogenase (short-subunit alcohol dehydrogenase family)